MKEHCVVFVLQSGWTIGSGLTVKWEGQYDRHCTAVVIYIWHGGIIIPCVQLYE